MTKRTIIGIASSPSLDAHQERMAVSQIAFPVPLPLCLNHDKSAVVGTVVSTWRDGDLVRFRAEVTDADAWERVRSGELCAASISLGPTKAEDDASGVRVFTGGTVKEISICEKGSNPDCAIQIEKAQPVHYSQPGASVRAPVKTREKATAPTMATPQKPSLYVDMLEQFGAAKLAKPATQSLLFRTLGTLQDLMVRGLNGHAAAIEALNQRMAAVETKGISYAGVWQRAQDYSRGNVVTDAGSAWVALRDVPSGARPGSDDAWQMMVKAGRDAR